MFFGVVVRGCATTFCFYFKNVSALKCIAFWGIIAFLQIDFPFQKLFYSQNVSNSSHQIATSWHNHF
ncbi:hypothetical protein SAMN05421780_102417 [Flexibacter flexilis DSM 6793]|uniref:Uncharacterized protein n=1 Tax=Flexibacter flexilis DSM 6793 TaxID=927664 RepID=A0A1I1G2M4_9BACT|nr:hypothetical protein SAMN05421780_102417 [Flexibacter flexilis DSM 6793]